jgi:hypothetical protein
LESERQNIIIGFFPEIYFVELQPRALKSGPCPQGALWEANEKCSAIMNYTICIQQTLFDR